jgi:hypothetical protein
VQGSVVSLVNVLHGLPYSRGWRSKSLLFSFFFKDRIEFFCQCVQKICNSSFTFKIPGIVIKYISGDRFTVRTVLLPGAGTLGTSKISVSNIEEDCQKNCKS